MSVQPKQPKRSKVTVQTFQEMKSRGEKIAVLTAYDFSMARFLDEEGMDAVMVGDSLGMVVQGHENTLSVTLEESLYHTRIVARAVKRALVIADMPFGTYQASDEQAVTNASRYLKEAGAHCVKLEGGVRAADRIKALVKAQIPVMGHIGLTPQSTHLTGGYKVERDQQRAVEDAKAVEAAGAFSMVLEGLSEDVADAVTRAVKIPTIGIGASAKCDGQVLVLHDMLGLYEDFVPRFVKQYANLAPVVREALRRYVADVKGGEFPGMDHLYQ